MRPTLKNAPGWWLPDLLLRSVQKVVVSFYGYGDLAADWYAKPDEFYQKQPLVTREEAFASVGPEPFAEPPPQSWRGRFDSVLTPAGLVAE